MNDYPTNMNADEARLFRNDVLNIVGQIPPGSQEILRLMPDTTRMSARWKRGSATTAIARSRRQPTVSLRYARDRTARGAH